MGSILVINAAGRETRVALVENGHIAEFYLERKKDKGVVGNIYKGRVVRVLPGMQAAFVDIGLEKAAFLYVSDVVYDPDFARAQFELTEGEHEEGGEVPDIAEAEASEREEQAAPSGTAESELDVQELAPGELPAPPHGEPVRRITGEFPAVQPPSESGAFSSDSIPAVESGPRDIPQAALADADVMPAAPPPSPEMSTEATAVQMASALEPALALPVAQGLPPKPIAAPETSATMPVEQAAALSPTAPASEVTSAPATNGNGAALETRGERRAPREQQNRERQRKDRDRDFNRGRERDREESKPKERKQQRIEDLLKPGQEVVVQISKDPIGTKGARLTSHISIPGRHLVFMPTVDHVGISRRIGNEKERRRLREIVDRLRPPGTGFIVRTVAENVPQEKLESDIRFLIEIWNQVVRQNEKRSGPGLLHPDLDLILRATRDLFAHDIEKLVIDDPEEYQRVQHFVAVQDEALKDRVVLHDNEEPIFDAYGIEQELQRATQRKVWLKSGGYLIMDQAEALTAIDVNSGRYVGKKSLEETITKINVEAAKEIVYQLRLRNIGGIIICDFIDMEKPANRDKVFKTLQEALGRDKAKTNVLRISELGLIEMTRKRVRESIGRMLHEDCPYCEGKGFIKTATTVAYEIFHEIRREAQNYREQTLCVNCNPEVARLLQGDERQELRHLMDRFNKSIQVRSQQNYHREQYEIYGRSPQGVEHRIGGSNGSPHMAGSPPARGEGTDPGRPREREQHRGGGRAERFGKNRDKERGERQDRGHRHERPERADRPDRDRPRGGAGEGKENKPANDAQPPAAEASPPATEPVKE